jgi:hypothetical protein
MPAAGEAALGEELDGFEAAGERAWSLGRGEEELSMLLSMRRDSSALHSAIVCRLLRPP